MRGGRWALVALIGAVGLSACGGGGDDADGTAAPAPTVTVTVTETASPADVEPLEESPTPEPQPSAGAEPAADPCAGEGLEGFAFIFVTSHQPGAELSSGDTVEGCGNTFEASFQYEVLDRDGAVLDEGFGTASCGSGCVGDISFSVDFDVTQETVGTLRVFSTSAQDGSEELVNAIPVRLQP